MMASTTALVVNPQRYTDASPSSPQIAWLQSELKRINRSETEHVAVLGVATVACSGTTCDDSVTGL